MKVLCVVCLHSEIHLSLYLLNVTFVRITYSVVIGTTVVLSLTSGVPQGV